MVTLDIDGKKYELFDLRLIKNLLEFFFISDVRISGIIED